MIGVTMTTTWRCLLLGWLMALVVAAGSIGTAFASPFEDGAAAHKRGDYVMALRLWGPLADKGHAPAQFNLGLMHDKGEGVTQNHAEAAKLYRRAAEQGYAPAQSNLGVLYDNGEGVAQNRAEAVKWYRRAAEQGYAPAQSNLGVRYAKGDGVAQNHVIAHMWFNLAASQGDAKARQSLNIAAAQMTPRQISEAQKLAAEWKPKTWDELKRQKPR